MTPYWASSDGRHVIYLGDCIDIMPTLEAGSVDAVVTDPPYGLAFMGKEWDHGVPGAHFWAEALRVAKPGAHLLAFGGTRTFHRLVCAIEDAGWEFRDTIMWVYGCLSDDTEVLTPDGWERYDTARTKEILAYDSEADVYQWEKPERWSAYRVEQDTAFRIESDATDQIVSRNHRCIVERGGRLAFVAAEECAGVERVPYLQGDLSALPQGRGPLLLKAMLRQGEGLAQEVFSERQGQEATRQGAGRPEEPSVEGRTHLLQAEGQVRQPVDQVRSMPGGIPGDGTQGWLRHGASAVGGDGDGATAVAERVRTPRQPRRDRQPAGEPDAVRDERGPQAARVGASYRTTLATVTPIEYSGLIFCPTVSTGAFVARRNGKVFITGNSGFPKSLNVGKAIDKAAGVEFETRGHFQYTAADEAMTPGAFRTNEERRNPGSRKQAPATDAAKQWDGWGTALKPAWEPIIVARKPLDGTVAENVLEYGTGAINVDGCRVESGDTVGASGRWGFQGAKGWNANSVPSQTQDTFEHSKGRWPANLIHDGSDEVLGLFPVTGPSKAGVRRNRSGMGIHDSEKGTFGKGDVFGGFDDSRSAARFFYCAKASKADRDGSTHPTVKPTDLMRYLCRLVTPPGGIVLDPFMGSGSTGKASVPEGFRFVGIELNREYCDIAVRRLELELSQPRLPGMEPEKVVQETLL